MGLFQQSVLNKYLNETNQTQMEAAYKRLKDYFHNPVIQQNIRESKEEQFQEGFLTELFVKVFGYTINPNPDYNLTTEYKNERGAKKADGAILKDTVQQGVATPCYEAIGVIELKSTKTKELEAIRLQAFDYKANHQKCIYVITSNFEKVRFYINNAVDFEEFDLFRLKYEHFQLMWLCLAKENLLKGIPLEIKEASLINEEKVTKQIYVDYSLFKRDLYNDLTANNLHLEIFNGKEEKEKKLTLFKKSQKLLDRFLFIFFGEDRGLLPPNSISEILRQWEQLKELDEYKPLYERYKKYISYLNKGWKGKKYEIFAYNGGLFAPDEVLDTIVIGDEVLRKHTKVLTAYDFETEVDVNILGHIFENSLNEIEELTAQIMAEEQNKGYENKVHEINKGLQPLVDQRKQPLVQSATVSKRKKEGVFYTPKYITKYIVENTVGKLCNEKKAELEINESEYLKSRKGRTTKKLKELDKKLELYRNWLLSLTICDPACGSGAFLNQALDFLIREHRYIDELRAKLLDVPMVLTEIENSILEKNIYGVDINEESVEIAKLSLWLRTAQKGRKLTTLSSNIKCGNSLIDDPEIAGKKAFNWQKEFPEIFRKKKKSPWHVTWSTHDTLTSERMKKYKVRERKANGEMYVDRSIYLNHKDAVKVTEIISDIVNEENYNCMAYNIGEDHIHIILVCDEDELTNIVRKLKGKSAQKFKEHLGLEKDETFNLWAQKFDRRLISSEQQLTHTIEYIENNREKHHTARNKQGVATPCWEDEEQFNKGLQPLVRKMTCSREHAFRTEYAGGFDVVIGNPPYGAFLSKEEKKYFKENYEVTEYNFDTYNFFFEKSINILKQNCYLGFITPNTFLVVENGTLLRNFLFKKNRLIELYETFNVFPDAVVEPINIIIQKAQSTEDDEFKVLLDERKRKNTITQKLLHKHIFKRENLIFNYRESKQHQELYLKLLRNPALSNFATIKAGIKPYEKGKGIPPQSKEVVKSKPFNSYVDQGENWYKLIRGTQVNRYNINWNGEYLKYGEWLAAPRNPDIFFKAKIVIRRTDDKLLCSYDDGNLLGLNSIHCLQSIDNNIELKYLLVLLNSKLLNWFFRHENFHMVGKPLAEVKVIFVERLPVKMIDLAEQKLFVDKANQMLTKNRELNDLKSRFLDYLQSKFLMEGFSNNLKNWPNLEFSDFLKELKKAKVKLTLSEEAEWMDYFNEQKQKARSLKSEIDKTDREIDHKVYELYGLTEEEIGVVEESV